MSATPEQPTTPPADEADRLSDHCYDGIQEFDNPTPRWWELMFAATLVFAPIYAVWFHAPQQGRTLADQYEASLAANMRLQFGEIGELAADEPTILKYMGDPEWLKVGAATFATHCVSCHGRQGEGLSGPNLTDDHYIHVKQVADIAKVVNEGAKNGAMPAWGARLHPNEVVLVSSYVAAMRGNNETSARPAEGNVIDPWPAAPPADEPAEPAPTEQAAARVGPAGRQG